MKIKGRLLRVIKGYKGKVSLVIASIRSNLLEYRRLREIKGRLRVIKGLVLMYPLTLANPYILPLKLLLFFECPFLTLINP